MSLRPWFYLMQLLGVSITLSACIKMAAPFMPSWQPPAWFPLILVVSPGLLVASWLGWHLTAKNRASS